MAPVIAMAEDRVESLASDEAGYKYAYEGRLRVAFVRGDEGWRAACKLDMSLGHQEDCKSEDANPFKQLYVHDGKYRRAITTSGFRPMENCCQSNGWLDAHPLSAIGRLGDRLVKWGGSLYEPAFKPEPVTNSLVPINDPQRWQETKQAVRVSKASWDQMKPTIDDVQLCRKGANVIRIAPQPRHIQVQRRYANIRNATLAEIGMSRSWREDCEKSGGAFPDGNLHWPRFWISNKANGTQTVHSLKHRTGFDRLEPIAFADFDGDGESEALFMLSGYVRDGYVLLFDGMNRKAMFAWAYH